MILIAPSLDPASHGGIERVSREVVDVFGGLRTESDLVLVSNDAAAAAGRTKNYRRRYAVMILDAIRMPVSGIDGPILCMHAGLSPVARILAWRLGKKYAVFLHGIEIWRNLPLRTEWGLSGAALSISNSRFTLSKFREWHPQMADQPAEVAHLGLPGAFNKLEEAEPVGFPGQGRFVISVGRLSLEDDYKGHGTLIRAIVELRKRMPDVFLVLAGGGNAAEFLKRLSIAQNDPGAVVFAGAVSDAQLLWLYRRSAVFAMLSEGEGFGLVHLEAMAQGKPCLGTHADAAAEIIEDGQTGRLVEPRDPQAAAAALEEMLGDPAALRAMGERARVRVTECFLQKHFAERLTKALCTL